MNNMRYLVILLSVLILVSGCSSVPTIWDPEVVTVKPTHVQEGPNDILLIKDIETLPKSSVLPDRELYVFYTIANADQFSEISNVYTEIYDPFVFTIEEEPDQCQSDNKCTILPLGEKAIQYKLRAPNKDVIAGIITDAELGFRVNYVFDSSFNFPVLVVNETEIFNLMRYGEKLERDVVSTSSAGPIQIRAELLGRQYLVSGFEASIKFVITETGSTGSLKGSIEEGKFVVKFPKSLVADVNKIITPGEAMFSCKGDDDYISCSNSVKAIDLIDGESSPLIFTLEEIGDINVPSITYLIKASVEDYEYELRNSVKITVVPE